MITHDFGQIKSSFEKGLNMMFDDVLDKREVFLDYKNVKCYKIVEIFAFFKGLSQPMILVKRLKFLPNLFLFQKGLDMTLMMF